jgi:hypothetical protein
VLGIVVASESVLLLAKIEAFMSFNNMGKEWIRVMLNEVIKIVRKHSIFSNAVALYQDRFCCGSRILI